MKRCYFCKGKIINKKIKHIHHWGEEIVVFENIPAEVCRQCGEIYFAPQVLKFMDQAMKKVDKIERRIEVPVVSFSLGMPG
jgi:YgiT-type zinc finger domain-containing protein